MRAGRSHPSVYLFVCLSVCLSVCVCVSVCNALTFKNVVLESLFSICRHISRIFRSSLSIKVIGSRSRSQGKTKRDSASVIAFCSEYECEV